MPANGDASTASGGATAIAETTVAPHETPPDYGETFQPHVDAKQIQMSVDSSPGERERGSR